jgi:hypothetical protein
VAVKLVISLILVTLVFTSLLPAVTSIDVASGASGDAVRAAIDDPTVFLYPPVVSSLMLLTAVVLSVTKPRWKVQRRRSR